MSKEQWAAIVYGRSFHLDFRFITIPEDFVPEDLAWASQHILATTYQARNLSEHPRWSLFKNNTHCIIGVTCMVRDLIEQSEEEASQEMVKDDHGRPLYVFVGYVTRLNQNASLPSVPAYAGSQLDTFKPLYQEVEQVWLVKDYELEGKCPISSQYQTLDFSTELINRQDNINHTIQLNHYRKSPEHICFWPDSPQHNNQLWRAAANCLEATSVCLAVKGRLLADSPFLNQTTTQVEDFIICDRLRLTSKTNQPNFTQSILSNNQNTPSSLPISQKISARAKEDLNLTLEQAMKMAAASQELINQISNRADSLSLSSEHLETNRDESENFGFKTKEPQATSKKQDWF